MLVSFDNIIDTTINEKVIALHEAFAAGYFAGFIETVPAYSSLAVFYDVIAVKAHLLADETAFDHVKKITEELIGRLVKTTSQDQEQIITVPVYYNGDDLQYLSDEHKISVEEIITIHTQRTYRIFMIGFQPGFAYMGTVDERIATPRKVSPRIQVPAGSVGIAGFQTGIYPFSSPGGWQLVGQTPIKIFDKTKTDPCFFKIGDHVKFTAIGKNEFEELNEY